MRTHFDTIVIGGGLIGAGAAWRLGEEGQDVLLLERDTVGFQASSRNAGGIRQQFQKAAVRDLARYSMEVWKGLSEDVGQDLEFRQEGGLRLAMEEDDVPELHRSYADDKAAGLPVELLDPNELASRLPAPINPDAFLLATYCATDAQANPVAACAAVGRRLAAVGVQLEERLPALSIESASQDEYVVTTKRGKFFARSLILAAGGWSNALLEPHGIELPVVLRRPHMAETAPVPPIFTGFIGMGTVRGYGYGRQTAAGGLHVGVRNLDATLDAPPPNDASIQRAFAPWVNLVPQLRGTEIIRTWSGYTVWTPDQHPIIGELPTLDRVYVATGFCGQGFGASAGVGLVLRDLVLGRRPGVDLTAFDPRRFDLMPAA